MPRRKKRGNNLDRNSKNAKRCRNDRASISSLSDSDNITTQSTQDLSQVEVTPPPTPIPRQATSNVSSQPNLRTRRDFQRNATRVYRRKKKAAQPGDARQHNYDTFKEER